MAQKAAVFCHNGLGDGIISLVLSQNLHQNGWKVDTYHNSLDRLQAFFPHLPILCYPSSDHISDIIERYDLLLVFQNDTFNFVFDLIERGKNNYPEKIKVIYPYPTKGILLKPYYEDSLLDASIPILENLVTFCKELLHLDKTTKNNGFIAPRNLIFRKEKKRVILHVASSRPGKNWSITKFLELASKLKGEGFEPVIIAGSKSDREKYIWIEDKGFKLPLFHSLAELTSYIYESAYLIGNDSGLAHLASCMGLPTLTISRRKTVAKFWKPSWSPNKIVVPSSWIPNISGFRLRDRKWQCFISSEKVLSEFSALVRETSD